MGQKLDEAVAKHVKDEIIQAWAFAAGIATPLQPKSLKFSRTLICDLLEELIQDTTSFMYAKSSLIIRLENVLPAMEKVREKFLQDIMHFPRLSIEKDSMVKIRGSYYTHNEFIQLTKEDSEFIGPKLQNIASNSDFLADMCMSNYQQVLDYCEEHEKETDNDKEKDTENDPNYILDENSNSKFSLCDSETSNLTASSTKSDLDYDLMERYEEILNAEWEDAKRIVFTPIKRNYKYGFRQMTEETRSGEETEPQTNKVASKQGDDKEPKKDDTDPAAKAQKSWATERKILSDEIFEALLRESLIASNCDVLVTKDAQDALQYMMEHYAVEVMFRRNPGSNAFVYDILERLQIAEKALESTRKDMEKLKRESLHRAVNEENALSTSNQAKRQRIA